jgi:hypothetical protein
MSKLANLITRVDVFEKIATLGSVKAVLKKMSQRTPDEGTAVDSYNKMEAGGRSVIQALQELQQRTNSPSVLQHMRRLQRSMPESGKLDINSAKVLHDTVKDIEMALAQEDYKKFEPAIREIGSIYRQMDQHYKTINWVASQASTDLPTPAAGQPTITPQDLPNAPVKQKVMVPEGVQKALAYLGYTGTLRQDNILGPETKNALNWFKDTYKIPFNGPTLYKEIMNEYNRERLNPKTPNLDDAAKQREEAAKNFRLT